MENNGANGYGAYTRIPDFCSNLSELARSGRRGDVLEQISSLVIRVLRSPFSVGRVFGSRDLDLLCLEVGACSSPLRAHSRCADRTIFLVTSLSRTGGHTRVLLDLIRAEDAGSKIVILTDIANEPFEADVRALMSPTGAEIEFVPPGSHEARLDHLQSRLAELAPRRTISLLHPFDSVAVAALQPSLTGDLIFIHNADHNLALGLHIPHARHVDLHAKGFYECRDVEGIADNVCWPLVVADPGERARRRQASTAGLKTCCAGGFEKFERPFVHGIQPYLYQYADILPLLMRASGGHHLHVGSLSADLLSEIRDKLVAAGIDPGSFDHRPFVADLARTMMAEEVDLYVGSFPLGGGRATVEAMAAGLPLLIHDNYQSHFLSVAYEVHPGAMIWRRPHELVAQLQALTPTRLSQLGKRARKYYLTHHHPDLLREAIKGKPPAVSRPAARPDRLQTFFDLEASVAHAVSVRSDPPNLD